MIRVLLFRHWPVARVIELSLTLYRLLRTLHCWTIGYPTASLNWASPKEKKCEQNGEFKTKRYQKVYSYNKFKTNYNFQNYEDILKFKTNEQIKSIISFVQFIAQPLLSITVLTPFIIPAHIPAAPGSMVIYRAAWTPIGLLTLEVGAILPFPAIQLPNFHFSLELNSLKNEEQGGKTINCLREPWSCAFERRFTPETFMHSEKG